MTASRSLSALVSLSVMMPTASFAGPRLEFEIGAGAAGADVVAPALNGRLGLSWTYLTASLRALTVIGATPTYVPGGRYGVDGSGYQASSFFGELRIHTDASKPGFQWFATIGAGVGKLSGSSAGQEEQYPLMGRLSHYEQLTAGIRYFFSSSFSASFELGLDRWNGLSQRRPPYRQPYNVLLVDPQGPLLGYMLLVSVAIRTGPL